MRLPCSTKTSRTAWWARVRARRWCWAWAQARTLPGQRRHGPGRRDRPDRLPGRRRRGGPAAGPLLGGGPRQGQGRDAASARENRARPQRRGRAGPYRHYMQKEIFEQPRAIADTLEGVEGITPELFGDGAYSTFKAIDNVLILACGTSYYSGCVAKYWLEASPKSPPRWKWPANTATAPACPTPHAGGHHHPKRRNRRHPGRAAPRAKPGHDAHADHLQRGHQRHGARVQTLPTSPAPGLKSVWRPPRPSPPSWPACFCSRWRWRRPKAAERGARSRAPQSHAPPARGAASRAGAGAPNHQLGRRLRPQRKRAVPGPRHCTTPSRWKARLKLKEISYIHAEAYPAGEFKHGPWPW
jgi:glutamine---fructose-6-phosphate transaminase (isomerizing)